MKKGKILIVDDNEDILFTLKMLLRPLAEQVTTLDDPREMLPLLSRVRHDVILLDMNFRRDAVSGREGFAWLEEILKLDPQAVVIFITAYSDTEKAVQAIKQGATDFIPKPWQNDKLLATVSAALQLSFSRHEVKVLKEQKKTLEQRAEALATPAEPTHIIGESAAMQALLQTVRKCSNTDANLLLLGENGTGKDLLARYIYEQSPRRTRPYIDIDLGSIPESLFESELFGYEKGAFTDARRSKPGRMEAATGGTLFLNEIGNLSLPMQAKLLSVIEQRRASRLGSTTTYPVDVRLICATNTDLYAAIDRREFRQDLLYRINTIELRLPPLRERGDDLFLLALANHIDTAVLVYTPQGNIEWKNEAATRLLATAVNELQEETWILKAPKTVDDLRLFHPDLPQLLRDLRPGSLHVIQVHQQEEGTQLALSGLEFILQGRKLIIASLKNIHSALDTQETLAWQKLIRVLTHEIMNSVTPIVSLAELLGKQVDGLEGNEQEKEDMRQMLATIARRGNALTRFVSSYREVSHLPPPLLQPLDATALLKDVVRFMQTEDNDLHLIPPPAPLRLLADKGQVEQVLINLIKNARENEARCITLSAGVTPTGRIFFRVTDDGTGIEPEVQERIFVPFFTTKPGGSGIGLTLARQIMHQHGGTIDVRSCPGEGSVFTLLFPYNH